MNHSFDIEIAKRYGILEAVLVNHFAFWIAKNEANEKNYHDGTYWTYNSTKAFHNLFPYATKRQIERALKHLRDEGVLKVGNYNENKYDRTLWYALTKKGKSILQNGEMEEQEKVNGNTEDVTPIPDINTDTNASTNTDNKEYKESPGGHSSPTDFSVYQEIYNSSCSNLSSCRSINESRKKAIRKFLKNYSLEDWKEVCKKANESDFLTGKNDHNWKANFDFLLRIDKAAKIMEGAYGSKPDYRDRYAGYDEGDPF